MVSLYLLFCLILNGLYSTIGFPNRIATCKEVSPEHLMNLRANGQYEEFARLLQIEDVNRVKPVELEPEDDYMPNQSAEYDDDMLWKSWQQNQPSQGDFYKTVVTKWNKVVPYVIAREYNRRQIAIILKAIEKWNQDLGLHILFIPHTIEKDYIMFINGDGCFSYIGKISGPQVLSISRGCLGEGIILHEMAHAIGITHEQQRPDRDTYIEIIDKNIPFEWLPQYTKFNYTGITNLGPYDYYSLMHYPIPAPETDLPAFKVLQQGIDLSEIGQRDGQTTIDKDKIKRLYRLL